MISAELKLSVDLWIACSTEFWMEKKLAQVCYVLGYFHGEIESKMSSLSNMALEKEILDHSNLAMSEETKRVGNVDDEVTGGSCLQNFDKGKIRIVT